MVSCFVWPRHAALCSYLSYPYFSETIRLYMQYYIIFMLKLVAKKALKGCCELSRYRVLLHPGSHTTSSPVAQYSCPAAHL